MRMSLPSRAYGLAFALLPILAATLFAASAPAGAALPDNRAYEQVTPVVKGGGVTSEAADLAVPDPSGDRVIVDGGFASSVSSVDYSWLLRTRTPAGWTGETELGPPAVPREAQTVTLAPNLFAVSADLSQVLFVTGLQLDARDQNTDLDIYERSTAGGPFTWVSAPPAPAVKVQGALAPPPNAQPEPCGSPTFCYVNEAILAGTSSDLTHVVWGQVGPLVAPPASLPGSPADTHTAGYEVYESVNGSPRLVGLVPSAGRECGPTQGSCVVPPCGAAMGNARYEEDAHGVGGSDGFAPVHGAVSSDGSQVVFTSPDPIVPGCAPAELYVRTNGTQTVEASASQKTNGSGPGGGDPSGPQPKWYVGSATDGTKITQVFFTSKQELTNDANTGGTDQGSDLYRYDVASGSLTDLSADGDPADANGAGVLGFAGAASDGSHVYFVATGVLAAGASAGQDNLYVYDAANGQTTFIAPAAGMVQPNPTGNESFDGVIFPGGEHGDRDLVTRVTPDGQHILFLDNSSLTTYDQHGYTEVYLYDAGAGALTCVSCNPSGAPPVTGAMLPVNYPGGALGIGVHFGIGVQAGVEGLGTMPLPMALSDDGSRVFFDSADQLTSDAPAPVPPVNGKFAKNVYEYEGGHVYLISPATAITGDTSLITTTPSGNDVFFNTMNPLVPQDTDGTRDIYDARVNGGFPTVSPPACSSAGCQGVPSVPPIFATPPSVTFSGIGNFPPPAVAVRPVVKLTAAQVRTRELASALKKCRAKRGSKRKRCEAAARKRYAPPKKTESKTKHQAKKSNRRGK